MGQASDLVTEEDCSLCTRMRPRERDAFRASLETLPLKEPVCVACEMAFWRNLGFPVRDHDLPEDEGKRIVLRRVN
jgi:hypothetical protein